MSGNKPQAWRGAAGRSGVMHGRAAGRSRAGRGSAGQDGTLAGRSPKKQQILASICRFKNPDIPWAIPERGGTQQRGRAERGGLGRDARGLVRRGDHLPLHPREPKTKNPWTYVRQHEERKFYVNPFDEYNGGLISDR